MKISARLLALVLASAACAHAGEIRIGLNSDIRSTEPGGPTRDTNTDSVLLHVVEGLVAYDENLSVVPMLARSYDVSADGRTYTFHMRPSVRFHNGAALTSADVKWSWDRILKPKSGWRCRNLFDGSAVAGARLLAVDAPDANTVVFRLEQASPIFLEAMASLQCLPAVLHRDSLAPDGSWKSPIGTGPYRLSEWKKGEAIVLRRFDGYAAATEPPSGLAGRKQALEETVRWIVIPEHAAQKAALLAGQIDIMVNVDPEDLPFPADRFDTRIVPALDWDALLLQTRNPWLGDIRMRRAIAAAIDRAALVKAVTGDRASANPSPISVASRWHSATLGTATAYDPAAAKKLLAQAGYRGQVLKLQTNKRYRTMHDSAVIIQYMLAKVGMAVELEIVDWATQLANFREGKFQLMCFGYSTKIDPSLEFAPLIGNKSKNPVYQWDDRSIDELARQIALQSDRTARQLLIDRLHTTMIDQVPILPLFNPPAIEVTRRGVKGYKTWSVKTPRLWNVKIER